MKKALTVGKRVVSVRLKCILVNVYSNKNWVLLVIFHNLSLQTQTYRSLQLQQSRSLLQRINIYLWEKRIVQKVVKTNIFIFSKQTS